MLFKKIYYKLFKDKAEGKNLKKIDLFEIKYKKLISETNNKVNSKSELNFLHSGTSGDLIYHGIIHLTHPDGIFILLVNRKI